MDTPYDIEPLYFVGESFAFRVVNNKGEVIDPGPYISEADARQAAIDRWDQDCLIRYVEARGIELEDLHAKRPLVWHKLVNASQNEKKVIAFAVKEMLKQHPLEDNQYYRHHIACDRILQIA